MRLGLSRLRLRLGERLLQILQRQFELVDPGAAFRGGPEALPSQPGDLQLEPFDRDLGHEPRRPLGQDHGVSGSEIGGKRRGLRRVRHTLRRAYSSASVTRYPQPTALGRQLSCGIRQSMPESR